MTLKRKTLLFTFSLMLAILILIGVILMVQMEKNFSWYLELEQESKVNDYIEELESIYRLDRGMYSLRIDEFAKKEELHLKLFDTKGNILREINAVPKDSIMRGNYVEREFPVFTTRLEYIGSIQIGFWDYSFLRMSADDFTRSMYTTIGIVILIGLLFSLIASFAITKSIVKPVEKIRLQTDSIRSGRYDKKIDSTGFSKELASLAQNINELAYTLNRQEESRKKYAQDISHELRTPVTALKLQLSAMRDGIRPLNKESVLISIEEVNRLNRLIEMLKESFTNDNQRSMHFEFIDLEPFIEELALSFSPLLETDGVQFSIKQEIKHSLWADRDALQRILYNLLSNAKKAMHKDGRIILSVTQKKGETTFTVQDDGAGISSKDLPFIFDRFYRGDSVRNTRQGGTGLGLSIVKSLVHEMNGTISVESTIGQGSTFVVRFKDKRGEQ